MIYRNNIVRFLIIIVITFFIASNISAVTRGVHIVSQEGKELYLYKDYHALVVGVGDYDYWPDLRGSVKDAREVADALKKAGMNVTLLLDPDSRVLKEALDTLTYKVGNEKNRAILFFFSGHGETETLATGEKLGFIIPKDAPLPARDRIGFNNKAISMSQIERYALTIRSKHVLMLFDSCFSGSVFSSLKGIPTDITEKSNRPVRQFITAGNENEQVPDESVFKTCFVQGINGEADANGDGYITGSELGMYLDSSVVNYSRGCQHPQYGKIRHPKLDKGDFIIKLASSGAMATLSVDASVSRAQVSVDGIEIGKTPLVNFVLSAGDHQIRVAKTGYEPYEKDIHIDEDRSLNLYTSLIPIRQAPQKGRLYVDTTPSDARVRILNIVSRYHRGMELQAGRYHVEVSAPRHETQRQWIQLVAGEDKYIDIRLATIKPPPMPTPKQDVQKTFTNSIGQKFVLIPKGTFMMGSALPASAMASKYGGKESWYRSDEHPQHRVTISKPFYLQTTEVSLRQWRLFIQENNYKTYAETGRLDAMIWTGSKSELKDGYYWDNPGFLQTENHPVTCVNQHDIQKFIKWLNHKENTNKYCLPTEAEWEYACRAETTTPFYTGACISTDQANYDGNYPMPGCTKGVFRKKTVEVGSFSPNAWGLYDMHGNVFEWCKGSRYVRGGSWNVKATHMQSAKRNICDPGLMINFVGFRLARAQ